MVRLGLVLLGLILGLIWAYQFAPVEFRDAEPVHLADGYKDQWIKMTAVKYAESGNRQDAAQKLVAAGVSPDMIENLIEANADADPTLVGQLEALLAVAEENRAAAQEQAEKVEGGFLAGVLGPLLCVVGTAVIGLILVLVFTFYWAVPVGKWARKRPAPAGASESRTARPVAATPSGASMATQREYRKQAETQRTDFAALGEAEPLTRHTSTYILGDDLYDDSFSIETEAGEFLGECGSGISETIGVGDPKKVTATEVWLFDKNDIRTVTKVLASEFAYNDADLRSKLDPKGEVVMMRPGEEIILETSVLRIKARIKELEYAQGASLPPNSFVQKVSFELQSWAKQGDGWESNL